MSTTLTAMARDAENKAVANMGVTLAASGSNNSFGQTTGATDANGVFRTTLTSNTAQSQNVTVTFGASLALTIPLQFVFGPAIAQNASFVVTPTTQTANGTSTILATVTLQDAQHHPVGGQAVTFSADGTSTSFTTSGTTSSAGQATASFSTTVAQTENLKASVGGLNYTAPVTFVAAPASNSSSYLTVSPSTPCAGGANQTTLTVTLADYHNNGIANQRVTFAVAGAAGPLGHLAAMTDTTGTATNTLVSPYAGTNTVFARVDDVTLSMPVHFPARTAFCTGNPTYVSEQLVAVQTTPLALVAGDLDADGNQDVAVVNNGSHTVSVLLGTGAGTFEAGVNYGVGNNPYGLAINDFNEDGRPDLVVANNADNTVSILLASGAAGSFAAPGVAYPVGSYPEQLCVGDFDGDGHTDVAVPNSGAGNISVLFGRGTGVLSAAVNYPVGNRPQACVVGDLNSDGLLDLVVANYNDNNVSVLLNHGSGVFASPVNYAVGSVPSSFNFAIGDFNGDGKLDLAVPNYNDANVSILLNSGLGIFAPAVTYSAGSNPSSVAVADINGDGHADLLVAGGNMASSILLGTGTGTFTSTTTLIYTSRLCAATGDFNNDGKTDLVSSSRGSNDILLDVYSTCN